MSKENNKGFMVYFEIYGKKMKASVTAKDKESAKQTIKDKIIFHKVNEWDNFNKFSDALDGVFKDIYNMKEK